MHVYFLRTLLLAFLWNLWSLIYADLATEDGYKNLFKLLDELDDDNSRNWSKISEGYYKYDVSAKATSDNAIEPPLKIGSFNVQTLTAKKFGRPNVMSTVEKVILRYDLILITEILMTKFEPIERLLVVLNRLAPEGGKYKVAISSTHPVTTESCAMFYRVDKLNLIRAETYDDPAGNFYRKPLIVHFKALTLRDMTDFVAVGLHVKPDRAVQEINELAKVYDIIVDTYKISDVMMMGDFNADCSYVGEKDWEHIALWTRQEFTWPIKNHFDTTTNHKSCALDRFVYAGSNMNNGVIMSSSGVFNFQEEYGLTLPETKEVSDHWPIEIQIRGKASDVAEKHLASDMCITMRDARPSNLSLEKDIIPGALAAGFKVLASENATKLSCESTSQAAMLNSLKKLRSSLPGIITKEQTQTLLYKVQYGSLRDESSYTDVQKQTFSVTAVLQNKISTVLLCRRTTLNRK